MANDQIKKADNGTYYFRANLGFDHSTGKRIQKYRSGFKTKKEAKEEYAKLVLQFASQSLPTEQKRIRHPARYGLGSFQPIAARPPWPVHSSSATVFLLT